VVDDHIDDETLEAFLLGSATANQVERIERHLLICPTCVDAAQKLEDYLRSMRKALESGSAGSA
jgi:Putative zinc-finger